MKLLKSTLAVVTAAAVLGVSGFAQAGATLDAVQKKGFVQCGVSDGLPGFSVPDSTGKIVGIDADFCRAVAAAVFGDATKVKFSQLNAKERFTALQSGEIDMLSRNSTMTSSRDAGMGLKFPGFITYYDGIGFLANNKLGVKSAKELDGATICIQAGTTTELNVSDYFRANGLKYTPITFDTSDESAGIRSLRRTDFRQVPAVRPAQQAGFAERLRRSAGNHFQGTTGPSRAQWRRRVAGHRALDRLRLAQRRRSRCDLEKR